MVIPVIDEHDNGSGWASAAPEVTGGTRITVHELAGASMVQIIGDVDLAVAARLRTAFTEALARDPWIIVDLRRTGSVDSVGLGVLVAAQQGARRQAGDLLLAAAPPFFVSVLRAARLHTVFPAFDTVPQAITHALAAPADRLAVPFTG